MEKRINGVVLEEKGNGVTASFLIRLSDFSNTTVTNCNRAPSTQESMTEGVECYSGNIVLNAEYVERCISARLWIYPDNNCVIVYDE